MGKKDDLYISVPSLFKCPISLDVMKSPVSLCTGVTYDRASIQRWLDYGHNTCPATMQVLDTKDFVPNHTLHRLIQIWSSNNNNHSSSSSSTSNSPQFHSLSFTQTGELIKQVLEMRESNNCVLCSQALFEIFVEILCFATESDENRRFLANNELFVDCLMSMVCVREGPICLDHNNPDLLEAVLKVLHLVATSRYCNSARQKMGSSCEVVTSLVGIIKTGLPGSRVAAAGIIGAIAQDLGSKKPVFENQQLVPELVELLKQGRQTQDDREREIQALLSCLISVSSTRRNKLKLIRVGGVKMVVDLMSSYHSSNSSGNNNDNNNNSNITTITIELLLTLLEMLVGGMEGRVAISGDPNCVPLIIHKLMKVSKTANEHGIALLWSLCYLFRDQKAKEAVMRSNGGLTKILLLMQSDCSPTVKRMCCDLLRIFKVNSKSCFASYDSKTTHIMPC